MSILKEYHAREFRKGIELVEDCRNYLYDVQPQNDHSGEDRDALKLAKRCDEWLDWAAWEDKE